MEYLIKTESESQKADFIEMLAEVRETLRSKEITFSSPKLVGSAKRNLILRGNEGFDLDYQLKLSKYPSGFSAKDIKLAFMDAFDAVVGKYGLENCEDSTHVITIKKLEVDQLSYSYDVAILDINSIGKYIILKNEKNGNQGDKKNYHFNELSDCVNLDSQYAQIKGAGQWQTLRRIYKAKKEEQQSFCKDNRKHSISLLMEAVNETLTK